MTITITPGTTDLGNKRIDWEEINKQFLQQLDVKIIHIEPLQGGANSQVAKIITHQEQTFLLKTYLQPMGDTQDRLGTEFDGLRFLWQQNIRSIPEPLFADRQNNFAVYRFINGQMLNSTEITMQHLSEIVKFFSILQSLINIKNAQKLPSAAEDCFTL